MKEQDDFQVGHEIESLFMSIILLREKKGQNYFIDNWWPQKRELVFVNRKDKHVFFITCAVYIPDEREQRIVQSKLNSIFMHENRLRVNNSHRFQGKLSWVTFCLKFLHCLSCCHWLRMSLDRLKESLQNINKESLAVRHVIEWKECTTTRVTKNRRKVEDCRRASLFSLAFSLLFRRQITNSRRKSLHM